MKRFSFCLSIISSLFILVLFASATVSAQRVTYQDLVQRNNQPNIYIDNFTLPADRPDQVQLVTTFRIGYDYIPFRKMDNPTGSEKYFSNVQMDIEVFRRKGKPGKRDDRTSVEGLEPVARDAWRDTVYASSYDETQSNRIFKHGYFTSSLSPGQYSYLLQLKRGEGAGEQRSRRRDISILPYQEKKQGNIIMVEPPTAEGTPRTLTLVNFGNNVEYATNFYALIHLPGFSEESQYQLQVHRSTVTEKDTTRKNQVYAKEIDDEPIYIGTKPQLRQRDNRLFLELPPSDGGSSYLLVKIPNSTFENGIYTITLLKNGQDSPVARSLYRSFWVDMPTSLLNLNVAIEMLRFIEDEKRIAKLKDGSDREKERKFREYWEKRDPTPDTEYNELMAEYYRRIDFAYRKYSTVNVNGFNTDQGKIYIRYGPPNKVERKLPPGEPAVEVWTYPNQEFIFRAISDFGQYELVRKRSL